MSLNIESMFAGESDSFELARAVKTYLVPLDSIQLNENNFYSVDDEGIRAIADSIAASGLIHPLSAMQEGNDIRLISGERRLRAMKLLKNEGIHYRFNGRDITGYAPLTYMQNVFGSREKLTIAAANASRDLTNEEKNLIIDEVTEALEDEIKKGRFSWPKGKKAHTLSVHTGIKEHYIKDYLARKAKSNEKEIPEESREYTKILRFLTTADKKVRETGELLSSELSAKQKKEILRKAALLCEKLEDLISREGL